MPREDLRDWLTKVNNLGELITIEGADWNLEIGHFADPKVSGNLNSVFLFDKINGYPSGYRIAMPRLVTAGQTALTFNLPECSQTELIDLIRQKWINWEANLDDFKVKIVDNGPVLENVHSGDDVDLFEFPVPKWNLLDGGRYIGTADAVVTKDLFSGEINLGTYRVMVHDKKTAGLFIAPGHHGKIHCDQYHAKGEACPIAVSIGHHPLIFTVAGSNFGVCEYQWAGAIRGEPIEVIIEEVTGLPIPADSEIVLAGWCPPDKQREEGPFGEWTGYYGRPPTHQPIIEVERIYHRNNPIMLGSAPLRPQPGHGLMTKAVIDSAIIHNELQKWGVPDVKRVWISEAGLTTFIIVSIKQNFAGHAKRAGLLASQSNTVQQTRYIVVVDEDIDVTNIQDVLWAICFRSDPEKDIDIIRRCRTEPLDPLHVPGTPLFSSLAIIDACKPYERINEFPKAIEVCPETADAFRKKWNHVLNVFKK